MGKKAEYPASLLKVLKVNDVTRSAIDYRDLTDDQMCGLEYALQNNLTEREAIVIRHYYQENMSMAAIAEKYNLPANRIKQIIRQAERKFQSNPEWLFYIANGYEAQTEYMQEQRRKHTARQEKSMISPICFIRTLLLWVFQRES